MKIRSRKTTHINYTINYENGITCKALTINSKLKDYSFYLNKKIYYYVENIDELLSTHFSDHYKFVKEQFKTLTELKEFTDFDKLYYVGGSNDGMVKDINDKFKSPLLILDSIFCYIWAKAIGIEHCESLKLKIDKHPWVSKCEVVDYDDYDTVYQHTLRIEVTPDEDFLNKTLSKLNVKYTDDQVKMKIFNEISK